MSKGYINRKLIILSTMLITAIHYMWIHISFKHTSSTNINQNIDKVSPKALLWPWGLASKYKVMCHARNTLTKYGGSPLSCGPLPPAPKGSATPIIRSKFQNYLTELNVCSFESFRKEQQFFDRDNFLFPIFWKIQTKNKMTVAVISFSWITWKYQKQTILAHLKYLCLVKSFRMSVRWALYDNFEVLTIMMGFRKFCELQGGCGPPRWPQMHFKIGMVDGFRICNK